MPRPLSWLPRLHDLRRSVANATQSHFSRRDLEHLFGLQFRAAQEILKLLPTVAVGTSLLVEREALAQFLDGVHAAADPAAWLATLRSAPKPKPRRKLQFRTDLPTVTLASLPPELTLETGRVEVRFETVEALVQVLFSLAQILDFETDAFVDRFEPRPAAVPTPERDAVQRMFDEVKEREKELGILR